jgi:hypothetical protein
MLFYMMVTRLQLPSTTPDSFPRPARNFIKQVIKVVEKYIPCTSFALFVFGSLSHKQDKADCVNGTSDVDLLVIVKDDVFCKAKNAWAELNSLQQFFFMNGTKNRGIVASILRVVERQTGMHESIFLARERDFKEVRFARIFRTNKIISGLLAPANIVFGSALCHMTRLHGNDDIETTVRAMQSTIGSEKHILPDLVKSLLMNVVLSIAAIVLLPITRRATRYSIESTKWSMYAATYLMIGERPSKPNQQRFFAKLGVNAAFLDRWMQLSKAYQPDVTFTLVAPWNVLKIHALGFKIKKIK